MNNNLLWIVAVIAMCTLPTGAATVAVAPAPAGEPLSTHFAVSVNDQNAPVYVAYVCCVQQVRLEIRLDGESAFASFDMGHEPATVTVTYTGPIQKLKLRPSSYGLQSTVSGNQVNDCFFRTFDDVVFSNISSVAPESRRHLADISQDQFVDGVTCKP